MTESYSNIQANELVRGVTYEKERYDEEERKEFRKGLIDHIRELIDYCESEDRRPTSREKLELLAYCILSTIDGNSGDIGGYLLIPIPESHFYDPNFTIPESLRNYDIAGELHSQFVRE